MKNKLMALRGANKSGPTGLMVRKGSARPKSPDNGAAMEAMKSRRHGRALARADELAAKAAEIRAEAERLAEEERQREVREEIAEEMRKEFKMRLLLSLDFTASTSGDIGNIVDEAGSLVARIEKAFPKGVSVLPIAVRGGAGHKPKVLTGRKNDLDFYRGVANVSYFMPTPVAYGVASGAKDGFFDDREQKEVCAAVTIGDSTFETPKDYNREVIDRFNDQNIYLAGLATEDSAVSSHRMGITLPLGELGIVVNRSSGEISAVDLIAEFLISVRDNIADALAQKELEQRLAKIKKPVRVKPVPRTGLADALRKKGFKREAGNVIQGSKIKGYLT